MTRYREPMAHREPTLLWDLIQTAVLIGLFFLCLLAAGLDGIR